MPQSDIFLRGARALNRDVTHYITGRTKSELWLTLRSNANVLREFRTNGFLSDGLKDRLDATIKRTEDALKLLE